jgi:hypothetical protein
MTAPTEIPIRLNFDPAALAASAQATALEASEARGLAISSAVEANVVAEYLREKMREKDAVVAMLKGAIVPLDTVEKTIRGWFKPTLDAFAAIEAACKKALGDYRLVQEACARAALARATAAMAAVDLPAATAALVAANAPLAKPAGVPSRTFWRATVIAADLLPTDWTLTVPNTPKIEAHAKAFSSDQVPTPIPGVRFDLEASVTVRR